MSFVHLIALYPFALSVGYIVYYQKPNLLLNQVLDKLQEAFTLFTRMIVKDTCQDISFEEAYEINLDDPQSLLYKEKIATKEEFGQAFLTDILEYKHFFLKS